MPKDDQTDWGHFMGLGLQMAIGVGLGLWVGSRLDRRYGWSPWGTLVCTMLGMAGGMYLMIKEAIRANKD